MWCFSYSALQYCGHCLAAPKTLLRVLKLKSVLFSADRNLTSGFHRLYRELGRREQTGTLNFSGQSVTMLLCRRCRASVILCFITSDDKCNTVESFVQLKQDLFVDEIDDRLTVRILRRLVISLSD